MGDFVDHGVGPDNRQMVVDALALCDVPFEETHERASAAQVRSKLRTGDAYELVGDGIRVVSDHDLPALPADPVQIRDDTFCVQSTAVRPDGFADGSAPVVDTRKAERQKTGPSW